MSDAGRAYLRLLVGLGLAAAGLFEALDTSLELALGVDIRAWHGVALFGAVEVVKAVNEIAEGVRRVRVARGDS